MHPGVARRPNHGRVRPTPRPRASAAVAGPRPRPSRAARPPSTARSGRFGPGHQPADALVSSDVLCIDAGGALLLRLGSGHPQVEHPAHVVAPGPSSGHPSRPSFAQCSSRSRRISSRRATETRRGSSPGVKSTSVRTVSERPQASLTRQSAAECGSVRRTSAQSSGLIPYFGSSGSAGISWIS